MAGNSSDCPRHEVHVASAQLGVVLTVRHNFEKEPSVDFVQFCTETINFQLGRAIPKVEILNNARRSIQEFHDEGGQDFRGKQKN
jgi:hypothetical protein